jgi:hypothetical protein
MAGTVLTSRGRSRHSFFLDGPPQEELTCAGETIVMTWADMGALLSLVMGGKLVFMPPPVCSVSLMIS